MRRTTPPSDRSSPERSIPEGTPVLDKPSLWVRAVPALKWAAIALFGLVVAGMATVLLVIRHYESDLPSVAQLREGYQPPQVTRVLARDGTLLANLFTERRTVVAFTSLPAHVKLSFLAAEDASFYEHEGLDYLGMLRALVANLRAGGTRQGGSTITQQVVKNILLEPDRTYRRKIRETILARRLEQHLSKDEIFHLYLNHIYLGHGRYGIEEASRYYFGKKAAELGLAEAALLAGIVAAPERYSPRRAPERALKRRRYVLGQMLAKGFIASELFREAVDAPLRLAPAAEEEAELAPEAVDHVKRVLAETVGERARTGGYVVTTTIDPKLQAAARRAARENLDRYAKRHDLSPPFEPGRRTLWGKPFAGKPHRHGIYTGTVAAVDDAAGTIDVRVGDVTGRVFLQQEQRYNPEGLDPSAFAEVGALLRVGVLGDPADERPQLRLELGPQSALVAIDPRTRHVLALVGSYEALSGGLDRATRARRQPGSAFKPFVYSYALHSRRFTPASVLELVDKQGGARKISLRTALAKSDNAAAEAVFDQVGPANVVTWAAALGIESELKPTRSLALGAYEVRPIELATAYATLASGGEFAPSVLITKITAPDGTEVPLPPAPPRRRVLSPEEAYLTTSLMRSVVEAGTARRAAALKRPVAGKTGTTNDAKDAWFAGYSTDLVAAVWVGYDDALPLGHGEAGSSTALPAWIEFMKAAHEGRPSTDFPRPSSIIEARIDPDSGLLAFEGQENAIEEQFLDGTAPTQVATPEPADAGVEAAPEELDALAHATVSATNLEVTEPPPAPPVPQVAPASHPAPGDAAPPDDLPPF